MGEVLDGAAGPPPSGRLCTVGIPVVNAKSLLRNCLQSVINSTLRRQRFEIVIADDGSSEPETRESGDGTLIEKAEDIVQSIPALGSSRNRCRLGTARFDWLASELGAC